MVDFRRPQGRQNSTPSTVPPEDDPWLISDPPPPVAPSEEVALLRQLVAAQKEQVLWSQRAAVVMRDIRNAPFLSLVWLLVKLAFAAIPAAIIIGIIWAIVSALISGVLAAILAALLLGASSGNVSPTPTAAPRPVPAAVAVAPEVNQISDSAYLARIRAFTDEHTPLMREMTAHVSRLGTDASLFEDATWKIELRGYLARLRASVSTLRTIEPNPRYQKAQSYWLEFADYTDKSVELGEAALDTGDLQKFTESGEYASKAATASSQAGSEISKNPPQD